MTDDPSWVRRTILTAVDPRSALKIGAWVGVCLFVAWMVAAVLIYVLLGATGVWGRVDDLAADLFGVDGFGAGRYFAAAAGVGLLEVAVIVLLVPLGALVYNGVAGYAGGLRLSLREEIEEPGADSAVDAESEVGAGDAESAVGAGDAVSAEGAGADDLSGASGAPTGVAGQGSEAAPQETDSAVRGAGWGFFPHAEEGERRS